jgi:hypothetical protein
MKPVGRGRIKHPGMLDIKMIGNEIDDQFHTLGVQRIGKMP